MALAISSTMATKHRDPRCNRPARASRGRQILPGLAAFAAALLVAGQAGAASLSGHVTLGVAAPPEEAGFSPYPGEIGSATSAHDGHATHGGDGPQDLVLYIEAPPGLELAAPPEATPQLAQIDRSFRPHVLGVSVGTSVEFPNEDVVFHNVFSYSKTKRFDLGYYGKGKSKSVRFDEPGLVKVFCDIHASMSAYILVVASPFVTQPDATGNYSFRGLPPGDYTLHLWHPELGGSKRRVHLGDGDTRLDLSL